MVTPEFHKKKKKKTNPEYCTKNQVLIEFLIVVFLIAYILALPQLAFLL